MKVSRGFSLLASAAMTIGALAPAGAQVVEAPKPPAPTLRKAIAS